ncbi:MAG: hypothetical protein XE11_0838 [Methanomicrobiales archaeon 53_19]|uniref:hypothetical protein n=1 Tax=Methanocalculus sp. TaxID=2004547 RepID=UPI000749CD4D|nr:hypothetical protein [Methanocalculus sp.]KUK71491.1 MAG: hypothetical protein XD88_0043 [Methanocalculus sp. 52_23]KUL04113.1 MAG: hypothetical protein XE11_0838 [Methanomicrobiales archaeon 53_19]HIJ07389.1 hypothetical protein [Methanocalculus sp.]
MVYRILLALAAILLSPFLLYRLFGMVVQFRSRQNLYVAVLLLAFLGTIGGSLLADMQYPQGPADMGLTFAILGSYGLISVTALLLPYILWKEQLSQKIRLTVLSIGSVLQIPFFFAFFVNPEIRDGGPLPLFADRLPLPGMLFDAIAALVGTAGETGYGIWFTIALSIGLFIQMALTSLFFYLIGAILMGEKSQE